MNYLFASTYSGCEDLLQKELVSLGAQKLHLIKGGIYYYAEESVLYNTLMWSRIASRIFLLIKKCDIKNQNDLYHYTNSIQWSDIFDNTSTFSVSFKGVNKFIRNSLFGALKIKDAIIDHFDEKRLSRPNIDLINPDIRIKSVLFNNYMNIMIDLSGEPLYKRGYRHLSQEIAPIKENLGCAILLRSGWKKDLILIDPMCGSGTFLIEAAMISSDRAPGLTREKWGFQAWKKYNKNLWKNIKKKAIERFKIGINTECKKILGYDYNTNSIKNAKENALQAGVSNKIIFSIRNLKNFNNLFLEKEKGIVLSNPPYGKRYQTENQLIGVYIYFNTIIKKYFINWSLSVISSSEYLLNFIRMPTKKEFMFKNGPLHCIQKNYKIIPNTIKNINEEYKNRLQKNFKKLKKWIFLENIECFRVYDADIPSYNIIVDVYKDWAVIQEYIAPKEIQNYEAKNRLCHAIYHTIDILSIPINNVILKFRKKQKNKQQYEKLFNSHSFFIVKEYHFKFLVNVIDYLDTGLFLEKRKIRKLINKLSMGKNFLNLFSYTGTASVAAGLGGAKNTTTIDISKTYIQWSKKNMEINNLNSHNHFFIQTDCLSWLKKTKQKFDLIFINPPTFSNSKRMNTSFDLKRDYLKIMMNLKKILHVNGKIIFSSSTRNFNLNIQKLKEINLYTKNITQIVQSKDYFKNSYIYPSWLIQHAEEI